MKHLTYEILSTPHKVEVISGSDLLLSDQWREILPKAAKVAIITQSNLGDLYGRPLCHHLRSLGKVVEVFFIPEGEEGKSLSAFESICEKMYREGFSRDSVAIGLGGGVVTDVAGFLASSYCRGIPLIQVPTTLLAMVDAAIGGKCGLNLNQGKNYVGSFYHPTHLLIDTQVLKTLSTKEYLGAFSEILKHALILDGSLFSFLEQNVDAVSTKNPSFLELLVSWNIKIKYDVVLQDEKESGIRSLLNFGHTIAHAIEAYTEYAISHGEAVNLGILVEAMISHQMGYLEKSNFDQIIHLMKQLRLPLPIRGFNSKDLLPFMKMDKKSRGGKARFILLGKIGACVTLDGSYTHEVSDSIICASIEEVYNAVWSHQRAYCFFSYQTS